MSNNIDIDALIIKFLTGNASPDEAEYVLDWIAESEENKILFEQSKQIFALTGSPVGNYKPDPDKAWERFQLPEKKTRIIPFWLSRAAVAVIAIGCILTITFLLTRDDAGQFYNSESLVLNASLSDGSLAVLEPNSTLSLDKRYGKEKRSATLTGSASFEVTHDEASPFVVEVEGVFVEDLGTRFQINSAPGNDTIFVVVEEGVVRLFDRFGSEIVIEAGEKAWYIKSQKKIITEPSTKTVRFDFNKDPLLEITTLLSETYDVTITLEPPSIGSCPVTTQFFNEDIDTILSILEETLDFEVTRNGQSTYTLKGTPCQD